MCACLRASRSSLGLWTKFRNLSSRAELGQLARGLGHVAGRGLEHAEDERTEELPVSRREMLFVDAKAGLKPPGNTADNSVRNLHLAPPVCLSCQETYRHSGGAFLRHSE